MAPVMSHKDQVRKFYEVLWDAHDRDAIPSVLHEDFTFRGSLDQEKKGHEGFAEYVDIPSSTADRLLSGFLGG